MRLTVGKSRLNATSAVKNNFKIAQLISDIISVPDPDSDFFSLKTDENARTKSNEQNE
jgi:hypothetical protein